jgi:hypothetical protein
MQGADPGALPWALSLVALGLDSSLILGCDDNSAVDHDRILLFQCCVALTDRGRGLRALLLRTPVAAAPVRHETTLEVIGSRTAVAEQTARCFDNSADCAPIFLGDAIECLESVLCE